MPKAGATFFGFHATARKKQTATRFGDKVRGSASARGYGRDWQKARLKFLGDNPFCKRCEGLGRVTEAAVVDHITDHKGDQVLFWDLANWQPLCKSCHDIKTGRTNHKSIDTVKRP